MSDKNITTLIEDIDNLILNGKTKLDYKDIEIVYSFGVRVASLLRKRITEKKERSFSLRMSNLGKSEIDLWYEAHGYEKEEELPASTILKFMYGDIIEELLLTLAELAGHSVTDRQKEVVLDGITGHIDAIIDGEVVDVKSASSYSFTRFNKGTLKENDSFGYYTQLSGYGDALNMKTAFLAMDKQMGHTCLLPVSLFDRVDVSSRITYLKEFLKKDTPPICNCAKGVEKNGNEYLKVPCSYSPYKNMSHPKLRTFLYSSGRKYLTKVVVEPRVPEIVDGEIINKEFKNGT